MKTVSVISLSIALVAISVSSAFAQTTQINTLQQRPAQTTQATPALQRTTTIDKAAPRQTRAVNEVTRRISVLTALLNRISQAPSLSENIKADWTTQVQEQISALEELKSQIEAADETTAAELSQTVVDTYGDFAVFMPKVRTLFAAESIQTISEKMLVLHEWMATEVANLEGTGVDIAGMEQMLIDAEESILAAQENATSAIELVTPLTGDEYPANRTVFQNARTLIREGRLSLVSARDSLVDLYGEIKTSQASGSATTGQMEEVVDDTMMIKETPAVSPTGRLNVQTNN